MTSSVLVVEDYADLRSAIVAALARRSVDCESAKSAADAIGKLRAQHYETIFLAPLLPIRTDPVMRFLHESQPDELSKVVLMTAPDLEEDPNPDDCRVLHKPFNHEELFASVK